MDESSPKLLVEFSLPPEGKARLQDFFDKSLDTLRVRGAGDELRTELVEEGLQAILQEVLPLQALESLEGIFSGKSDYALLIRDLPEAPGFESLAAAPPPKDTYTFHIGRALHRLFGAQHSQKKEEILMRGNGMGTDPGSPPGRGMHRDFSCTLPIASLSTLVNSEHARTEIINLVAALETLPVEDREKLKARVVRYDKKTYSLSLEQVLADLKQPGAHFLLRGVAVEDPQEKRILQDAIDRHSASVDLQPGQLLIWDETSLFHRAQAGDVSLVPPASILSRVAIRAAGSRVSSR